MHESDPQRVEAGNITAWQRIKADFVEVFHHIAAVDLNPHEGKLRASAAPSEYIKVPDCPPDHDDTM